jgi:hypothetical protein
MFTALFSGTGRFQESEAGVHEEHQLTRYKHQKRVDGHHRRAWNGGFFSESRMSRGEHQRAEHTQRGEHLSTLNFRGPSI